ncbi:MULTISPECIES: hypothetical protein [unclassified Acinetobacter]|uniref:hypothetical protein n=1 Tax=unclassified Acinetobacter TaxID=196816 RepID=UPI001C21A745|nr:MULTISPECIES: hypothetical protein [unclassified Acinetobacter]
MHELQALVQGKIPPQSISIDYLIEMAECHTDSNSAEYKLVELAINIVLVYTLDKALQHL